MAVTAEGWGVLLTSQMVVRDAADPATPRTAPHSPGPDVSVVLRVLQPCSGERWAELWEQAHAV